MRQSIPFSLALVLLLGGMAIYRSRDVPYNGPMDGQQAFEFEAPPWVQLAEAKALSGRDAPLVRDDPYAYVPASCAYSGRDASQAQRALELTLLLEEELRVTSVVQSNRPWCGTECAPLENPDLLWQETAGDPVEEGCWVWVEYYSRSLVKQKIWPLCTCKYDWSLLERPCAVASDALEETRSDGPAGVIAEAFPDTALQDAVWAAGW